MQYLRIFFLFLIVFFVISCTKKSNDPDISFSEQSLANDVLATVSMLNDSVYVVGGENGEIYLLNSSNDSVVGNDKPDLARIYCLYADGDTFYAAVRNSGIVKLVREDKKLKIVKQQYKIPHKGTNYSTYNIIPYRGNTLIAMTSNGLYYFSNDTSDVLYPIPYGPDSGTPFSYCSPISIGDDIYVGTTKGIVKINSKHGKPVVVDSCLVNKAISKVVKGNDNTIYALSECHGNDTLYTINIKDNKFNLTDTCGLDFSALSFVKAEDKFYFVNEHNLYVISSLGNMKKSPKEGNYVVIKLPHAPISDARNLIVYDKCAKKIRIITQKVLLSLPSVNSIGQSKGQICGVCYDVKSNKVYFQNTKKEVFEYENGQASKSKFVKFDPTEEISSFSAFDNTLFYISNHEQVKSKKTGFLQFHSNRPYNLPKKSTAMMLVDDSVIYVGIRDSLLRINLTDNRMESLIKDIEPYVTKLKKHGDSIVVSTLNDGLIFLHDGYSRKTMFDDVHFQNDYVFTSESKKKNSILLLNNHYLRFYTGNILQDSVPLRGYERLLFSPQKQVGVAVKRSGVQYFKLENNENRKEIKLLCSESRPISPDGCMIINDTLFLAADEGMLKTPLAEDKLPNYASVDFDSSDIDVTKTVALVAAIVFFVFVLIFFIRYKQFAYKLKQHLKDVKDSFHKKEEEAKMQYQQQMHQIEKMHNSKLLKLKQDIEKKEEEYKSELSRIKKENEKKEEEHKSELSRIKKENEKRESEYKTEKNKQINDLADYLKNVISEIDNANKQLKDSNEYDKTLNRINEYSLLIDPKMRHNLTVSKISEISQEIQGIKLRLNEMLIGSLKNKWEIVARYCNKNKGIAEAVRKAVNDGDLNTRIEQIKKCEEYLNKIRTIKKYRAISSLRIGHFSDDVKSIIIPFNKAEADKDGKSVEWESIIEEVYRHLCDIEISKEELKDCITNLKQEIIKTFLYMEQIKQREIELNCDLVDRLIDDSKRKKVIQNKIILFDEINSWNDISDDENIIGKALFDNLEKLNNDNSRDTKGKGLVSYLMKIVVLNDHLNMSFLLILINGMIDCFRKERGNDYPKRQAEWSKLINKSIYQFFSIVEEHGTDKDIFLEFGGKEIIANNKDDIVYPFKLLALTMALGKIVPNKEKKVLKDYLDSPTSWYNKYKAFTIRWKDVIQKRKDNSDLQDGSSFFIYLKRLV